MITSHTSAVEKKAELRRALLLHWITETEKTNVHAWCLKYDKPYSLIAGILGKEQKSFGEKLALDIETRVPQMPSGYLVNPKPLRVMQSAGVDSDTDEVELHNPADFEGTPVVGTAKLGSDGTFYELEHPVGFGDGRLRYVSRDKNAYAVRVVGDSMSPRIRSGEFVVVEPNHKISSGDDVLVITTKGQQMVKEYLFERGGIVTLESVNAAHGRLTIPRVDIDKMHYVVATTKDSAWEPF